MIHLWGIFDVFNASALHEAFEGEFDRLHVQQMCRHAVDSSCVDQLQMGDLWKKCALYSHGNYTLTPDFAAFTVPHAVWPAESQEDKDAAFGEFLACTARQKRTTMITLINSVLTMPARPDITRKLVQRMRACTEWAMQKYVYSFCQLALFTAITFSRTRHHVFLLSLRKRGIM